MRRLTHATWHARRTFDIFAANVRDKCAALAPAVCPPTEAWLRSVVRATDCLAPAPPQADAASPRPPAWRMCFAGTVMPLATATTRQACRRRHDVAAQCLLPTRNLQLPDDHYATPPMVDGAVEYRQPEHILPRYADFMYRVVLGAVAIRSRLNFLADYAQVCPACGDLETYDRPLLRCEFFTAVWAVFQPLVDALELELPTTLSALLFEPLVTAQRYRRRAVVMMWPILRACVLHTVVWLARNDRVFRPEAPLVTPAAAA